MDQVTVLGQAQEVAAAVTQVNASAEESFPGLQSMGGVE